MSVLHVNRIIHVLNHIIFVLNTTIFAICCIISVSGTKWDVKTFLFSLISFSMNRILGQINFGTDWILWFQNGCNKVVTELRVMQFWSEIIFVISSWPSSWCSSDFKITHMILLPVFHPITSGHYVSLGNVWINQPLMLSSDITTPLL